jgi:hypothetical protein
MKNAGQSGGQSYFQRQVAGTPMSALFVGDGRRAQVFGFNELIVRPMDGTLVYCGAIGPVPPGSRECVALRRLLDATVAEFDSRAWQPSTSCSKEHASGARTQPAAIGQYGAQYRHLQVSALTCWLAKRSCCLRRARRRASLPPVQGSGIVYAPRPLLVSAEDAAGSPASVTCTTCPQRASRSARQSGVQRHRAGVATR